MFDEKSMLPQIVYTTVPMSDGASLNSMEVQVDLEHLSVIPEREEPCNPKLETTPTIEPRYVNLGGLY